MSEETIIICDDCGKRLSEGNITTNWIRVTYAITDINQGEFDNCIDCFEKNISKKIKRFKKK